MPRGSTRRTRRTSPPQSGSGCSNGAEDRPGERCARVRRMVEEQSGLDKLQLHDAQRTFVVGKDVDPGISDLCRSCRKRSLRKRDGSLRGSVAVAGLAAVIFLNSEIARPRPLDDRVAELAVEQHQ